MTSFTGAAIVAGVVGQPVAHSLSPLIHNAWIAAAGIDAVYAPFSPSEAGFEAFIEGLRGGVVRGLNVTIPFKEAALRLSDQSTELAQTAGAANLLLFEPDGTIRADNTDGIGMLEAIRHQAPGYHPRMGPAVILGAGGAARGAAAALLAAGSPSVRLVNRSRERAMTLARDLGQKALGYGLADVRAAMDGASLIVNATSLGLGGGRGPEVPLEAAPPAAIVMDMVYKPLRTEFLQRAAAGGRRTVDGLEMLIRQAMPSFEAFYSRTPPETVDVRALALGVLEAAR